MSKDETLTTFLKCKLMKSRKTLIFNPSIRKAHVRGTFDIFPLKHFKAIHNHNVYVTTGNMLHVIKYFLKNIFKFSILCRFYYKLEISYFQLLCKSVKQTKIFV